jgi:hypothetical protein
LPASRRKPPVGGDRRARPHSAAMVEVGNERERERESVRRESTRWVFDQWARPDVGGHRTRPRYVRADPN